jgi:hypothetical protein
MQLTPKLNVMEVFMFYSTHINMTGLMTGKNRAGTAINLDYLMAVLWPLAVPCSPLILPY